MFAPGFTKADLRIQRLMFGITWTRHFRSGQECRKARGHCRVDVSQNGKEEPKRKRRSCCGAIGCRIPMDSGVAERPGDLSRVRNRSWRDREAGEEGVGRPRRVGASRVG